MDVKSGWNSGAAITFLALADLIRSKETERAADWQDVAVLEAFLDARMLAQVTGDVATLRDALGKLRSRSGFEAALQAGLLASGAAVEQALARAHVPITQAWLLPFAPATTNLPATTPFIEPVILRHLRTVVPSSALHLALVEAVRRQYRLAAQAADKADKEAVRRAQDT